MCAAIFALAVLAYLPALSGGFLWDDNGHVTRPDLRSLSGLFRIWFEIGATQQYYPLLHSAFWFEHLLWGDATLGYHLVNVLLHATAACLFGTLLRRLAVPGACLAALMFALHPVCVESVAWISEQKNTLSAVFYLAAALAYLKFDSDRRSGRYALASGLFLLALLTKTVTASLPAALLVVCWWQRGRLEWRRDVLPLLPWFALGAASGLFTAHFERELIGAQGADFDLSLVQRCLLAGRVFWFYLGKLAWPAELVFIYPHWTVDAAAAWQWLFLLGAIALLVALVWQQRRSRAPLAAALLFGGTLFPVLGFVNIYPFVFSYVADHFQYLASLAVFALAAAALTAFGNRLPPAGRMTAAGGLLAFLGSLTWMQCGMYRDVTTLYETTLRRNPDCWMAHNNLAIALADSGRVEEAIPHLEAAIRLKPDFAPAYNNLGNYLQRLGRTQEAVPQLERAVQLQPAYGVAHRNLGVALSALGRPADALPHFEQAIRTDATDADAENEYGVSLMVLDRVAAALPHLERAARLRPDSAAFQVSYGRALETATQTDAAIACYEAAVRLDPNLAEAHLFLAFAFRRTGRMREAVPHFMEVERLNPSLLRQR
jgi:tetratricopeptide (TPR) repeat protein